MPDINRYAVEVWKRRFRRMYATDLPGLKTLSDQIAAEAGEMVTITKSNEDGNDAEGVVTGSKLEMLSAAEELITELDTAATPPPSRGRLVVPNFNLAQP